MKAFFNSLLNLCISIALGISIAIPLPVLYTSISDCLEPEEVYSYILMVIYYLTFFLVGVYCSKLNEKIFEQYKNRKTSIEKNNGKTVGKTTIELPGGYEVTENYTPIY